jgi:hypothetical protein
VPQASAAVRGTAYPGGRLILTGEGSQGAGLRYRWVQTQGPKAVLESPDQPTTAVIVPELRGEGSLGFLLVVANAAGMDSAAVLIPLTGAAPEPPKTAAAALQADAGDDQIALPGRQVTLNGIRSEPRGRIGYRWIQVGGPKIRLHLEDGYTYSFVPHLPGTYRFALVVASGSEVSEPDTVAVTVASLAAAGPVPEPAAETSDTTQDLAQRLLASVRGGHEAAEALSEVFAAIADRMDLYQSYAEMYREISQRLETILPADPAQRTLWTDRVFTPLTARLVEKMVPEGLDLRRPESQSAELTLGQRARIAELFREVAEGFRAVKRPR